MRPLHHRRGDLEGAEGGAARAGRRRRQAGYREDIGRPGFRFVAPVFLAGGRPSEAGPGADSATGPNGSGRPSVAVLPFRLVGQTEDHAAIADAVPAELIASLSRLRWLKVLARASTFRFRDRQADPDVIGSTLGASYCLSGIVEVFGPTLRGDIAEALERTGIGGE